MSETISSGIRCPRCGRKEAVIELKPLVEKPDSPKKKSRSTDSEERYAHEYRIAQQITVTHTFCGYQQTLRDYLGYHIIRGNNKTIDVPALVERKLIVKSEEGNTSAEITKALSSTEGYFTDYCFVRKGNKITSIICPFCNGTSYTDLEDEIVCKCGHYQIPAFNKIYTAVQKPFKLIEEAYPTQQPLRVTIDHSCSERKTHTYLVAQVNYFFNRFEKQRVFIVTNISEGRKTDFPIFLKFLKANSEPLFTVIEKI
ncbi:MAG TPA: hypothetical protein VLH94_01880 [Spirochaetia bacterium]|nr:hypothetical protein [Spirochaetia bacterium]